MKLRMVAMTILWAGAACWAARRRRMWGACIGWCLALSVSPSWASIQYAGYYWAYSAPGYLGDYMAETAPFTNVIFINVHTINTATDASALDAVRRAKSLGLKVILDAGSFFCKDDSRWYLCPDWRARFAADRSDNRLDDIVREGNVLAWYFMDEPDGNGVTKAEQETVIGAIHEAYPGMKVMATYQGTDWLRLNGVPAGLDMISFDDYGLDNRAAFDAHYVEQHLRWIEENTNLPILLTVEAFDGRLAPSVEQQSWHVETALSHPRVIGLLYFAYTDRVCDHGTECWMGARGYPELIAYHKQIFAAYISGTPVWQVPIGWLDSVSPDGVASGWALDPDVPDQPISVHFYLDGPAGTGVFAGTATADLPRPDVNSVTGYSGDHGFAFSIPDQFRDGRVHQLYVHGIDNSGDGTKNVLLQGVPGSYQYSAASSHRMAGQHPRTARWRRRQLRPLAS